MSVPRTLTGACHALLRRHGAFDISGPRTLALPDGRAAHLFRGRRDGETSLRAVVIVGDDGIDGPRPITTTERRRLGALAGSER